MPLPLGFWKININGSERDFQIQEIQAGGVLVGTFEGFGIHGFWDEASQTITFDIPTASADSTPNSFMLFKGYLFRTPASAEPGRDVVATLTGFVQVTKPFFLPGNNRRNVFGWFAQIPEIL